MNETKTIREALEGLRPTGRGFGDPMDPRQLKSWESVETALAALTTLEDRIKRMEEALVDKDRLDFLDQANARLNARFKTTYRWELIMNHNVNRLMLPGLAVDLNDARANGLPSCRDAIDAAMKATATKSPETKAQP